MASNQFANTSWVSMEILRLLVNSLVVTECFDRSWEKDFNKEFAVGSTIQVKFPQRFLTSDGMGYAPQGISRVTTTVALDNWIQVAFEWDDYEQAIKLERSDSEIRENYLNPAAAAIAQEIDSRAAKWAYQNASNIVGSLGTDPTTVATYFQARQILAEEACPPKGKRYMIISSDMMQALGGNTGAGAILSYFNPPDELSKMFKEGAIGGLAGFEFFESNSLYSHTAGNFQTPANDTVNGANQSGTAITINATAGDVFKFGDKISFANVNRVNPMTRRIVGPKRARTFTITQPLTCVGGGVDVINILPAMIGPTAAAPLQQYQNVDALPASGALITLWPGTSSPNNAVGTVALGLSRYAFALVGGKLYEPTAVESAAQQQDPESGIALRKVKAWDPVRSMQINRIDSLLGFGNLYQANGAVCVLGA